MAGNANDEAESQLSGVSAIAVPDDIFLSIQRATIELFAKSKNEFMSELSNNCDFKELRYVRDMIRMQHCHELNMTNVLLMFHSGCHGNHVSIG